ELHPAGARVLAIPEQRGERVAFDQLHREIRSAVVQPAPCVHRNDERVGKLCGDLGLREEPGHARLRPEVLRLHQIPLYDLNRQGPIEFRIPDAPDYPHAPDLDSDHRSRPGEVRWLLVTVAVFLLPSASKVADAWSDGYRPRRVERRWELVN